MRKKGSIYRALGIALAALGLLGSIVLSNADGISTGYYGNPIILIVGILISVINCVAWFAIGCIIDCLDQCLNYLANINEHYWNLDHPKKEDIDSNSNK